ncbi:hypothetical protein A2U01_0087454, partial [Trifolium medium]|nr:hypothetical protein [Trifolium medium]
MGGTVFKIPIVTQQIADHGRNIPILAGFVLLKSTQGFIRLEVQRVTQ